MTILAKFDGKAFIPVEPVNVPVGRVVEIDLDEDGPKQPMSGLEILRELDKLPKVSPEVGDELMRLIEEGEEPATFEGVFDHLIDAPEADSNE